MGGLVSDRFGNRRFVMLAYMLGIAVGFLLMGLMNSKWPLIVAVAITVLCSVFVQGAEGATFGIIPRSSAASPGRSPVWPGPTATSAPSAT